MICRRLTSSTCELDRLPQPLTRLPSRRKAANAIRAGQLSNPLIIQTQLVGVLYLQNNLAPRVFVETRNTALQLLASQAHAQRTDHGIG